MIITMGLLATVKFFVIANFDKYGLENTSYELEPYLISVNDILII
jgi:hypothetical protein